MMDTENTQPGRGSAVVTSAMVSVFNGTIKALRDLDDVEGGDSDNLAFVHRHFREIAAYLRYGRFANSAVLDQLLLARAELSQIAGWMAYDADEQESASRYFRIGLHAAHLVGAHDLASHIVGCMAFQAVDQGRGGHATELAEQARREAYGTSSAVRALAASRYGLARAADGDEEGCRAAMAEARAEMGAPDVADTRPSWLYWFDESELDVQAGHSLITLSFATGRQDPSLLMEAERLLDRKIPGMSPYRPRDAVLHSAWAARSCLRRGDVERALTVGWNALGSLGQVRSRRTMTVLQKLDVELGASPELTGKNDIVAFRGELEQAFAA